MADFARDPPKEVQLPPRLPLVGVLNQRGQTPERDSRLINGYVEQNADGTLEIVKRPGLVEKFSVGANRYGAGLYKNLSFWNSFTDAPSTTSYVYKHSTLISSYDTHSTTSLTDPDYVWADEVPVGETTSTVTFFHNLRKAYTTDGVTLRAVPDDDDLLGPLTCGISIGLPTVTTASTTGLSEYSGVTGAGIPASTTILSIDSPTQFTMTQNATATNAAAALSFTLAGPEAPYIGGVTDLNTATYLASIGAKISTSDPLDPYGWDPLARIVAYADQSPPMAIAKHLSYIVVFKQISAEFFRDAGVSPGSPLARVDGMKLDVGCYSEKTFTVADGLIFWVSYNETGLKSAWILEQGRPLEVATPQVRRVLEGMEPKHVFALSVSGHSFFLITDPAAEITLVYDKTSGFWSYWHALGEAYFPFVAASYVYGDYLSVAGADPEIWLQHESNGKVYTMSASLVTDAGASFDMDIFPPEYDANSRLTKYLSKMYVIADQEAGSKLLLRVNDDNQQTDRWSNFREFDLSESRPRLDECGSFYKRSFHFRHSSPTACRVKYVELDLQLGTL